MKPGHTLTLREQLKLARATGLDMAAIDRVLELGYPLDRARRAVQPYRPRPVSPADPDPGAALVDRWVRNLHDVARLQTELRIALCHQRWMRERLSLMTERLRSHSTVERFDELATEAERTSWPHVVGLLLGELRDTAIEIDVACEVYLASPTDDIRPASDGER